MQIQFLSKKFFTLMLLCCFLLLNGCANQKINIFGSEDEPDDLSVPVGELIIKGMDEYNVGNYFMALNYFEKITDSYPFSPEASLAELKIADCKYYMSRYLEAEILYEEFEERHPTNEAIPYVMYQRAMCNYKRLDRVDRDITGATDSIKLFSQLIRAYPNSPYTEEAKARIRAANEFLVHHEYLVVEFYLRTEKYNQAKTRLKYILAMYPDSAVAPKAKELLTKLNNEEPPESDWGKWFPSFSLPDWNFFGSDNEVTETVEQEAEETGDKITEGDLAQ